VVAAEPQAAPVTAPAPSEAAPAPAPFQPERVELHQHAMGTSIAFVAYTSPRADEHATKAALEGALAEMRRLEALMSEWRDDSEIGRLNLESGEWVTVSPETLEVVKKGLWAGSVSQGVFDITFQAMSDVWKFGSDRETKPRVPSRAQVERRRKLVDYRRVQVDDAKSALRIGPGQKVGLGGIAKGYIVDRAVRVLRDAGLEAFLVQAGGDLYGAGRKPDDSPWVSAIQDPRGPPGSFFASIALEDHAFSTAGDYARAYVVGKKRYHHIIDPRTGYPATACRSVTVWAPDAFTADVIDDIVFILGPKIGLSLVESLDGVGVVIVDAENHVIVSPRLEGKVRMVSLPKDGI
jgi:thiamine biosynthesis lipoprotein